MQRFIACVYFVVLESTAARQQLCSPSSDIWLVHSMLNETEVSTGCSMKIYHSILDCNLCIVMCVHIAVAIYFIVHLNLTSF